MCPKRTFSSSRGTPSLYQTRDFAHRLLLLLALGGLTLPRAVSAVELTPAFDARVGWDSDVRSRRGSRSGASDGSVQIAPQLGLRGGDGDLGFGLDYRLSYEHFFRFDGEEGVDHFGGGTLHWAPTARTRFDLASRVSYRQRFDRDLEFGEDREELRLDESPLESDNRGDRSLTNTTRLSFHYNYSARWQLGGDAEYRLEEYDGRDRNDRDSVSTSLHASYRWDIATRFGFGVSAQRDVFEGTRSRAAERTESYHGFLSFNYTFSPRWQLDARVGPSFRRQHFGKQTRQRFVPEFVVGEFVFGRRVDERFRRPGRRDIDVFASLGLNGSWRSVNGRLSYSRYQGGSGGRGGSSTSDSVTTSLGWNFARSWSLSSRVAWIRRRSLARSESGSERTGQDGYYAQLRMSYRWSENLSGYGLSSWSRDEERGGFRTGGDDDVFRVLMGVRVALDAFRF